MSTTPDEEQEFLAPNNGGWHWTTMRDWIAVCPDIGSTAVRLYWIVRSIMHEKGDKSRRLSIDHLCWLLPGVNGKPTSATRVKDALRELEKAGLLSNPEDSVTRQWVRDPRTGKQTKENFRRWQIHDLAPGSYGGWRSAIAKLSAYPGVGWQDTEGRKTDSQSDPSLSPAETPEPAGHTEGRKTAQSGRNSDQSRRKSGDSGALTSGNESSKESFQAIPLTNQPPVIRESDRQEHGDDGWLDEPPIHPQADRPRPGVRFLCSLPAVCRPDMPAIHRLAPKVEQLLAGELTEAELLRRLTGAIDGMNNPPGVVIHRLEGLVIAAAPRPARTELTRQAATAARAAAEAKALVIANCPLCDDDGYVDAWLCDHNPVQADVNESGRARAQAMLAATLAANRQAR